MTAGILPAGIASSTKSSAPITRSRPSSCSMHEGSRRAVAGDVQDVDGLDLERGVNLRRRRERHDADPGAAVARRADGRQHVAQLALVVQQRAAVVRRRDRDEDPQRPGHGGWRAGCGHAAMDADERTQRERPLRARVRERLPRQPLQACLRAGDPEAQRLMRGLRAIEPLGQRGGDRVRQERLRQQPAGAVERDAARLRADVVGDLALRAGVRARTARLVDGVGEPRADVAVIGAHVDVAARQAHLRRIDGQQEVDRLDGPAPPRARRAQRPRTAPAGARCARPRRSRAASRRRCCSGRRRRRRRGRRCAGERARRSCPARRRCTPSIPAGGGRREASRRPRFRARRGSGTRGRGRRSATRRSRRPARS